MLHKEYNMPKNNYERVVSPVGIAQYAWLSQPDTRFDAVGHFKTNLIVNAEEAQGLVQAIDKAIEQSVTLAKENTKGKKIKQAPLPYIEEIDDEGNVTDNLIFKFKTKAEITTKDGTVVKNKVPLFDTQGTPILDTDVWSGSELKVSAELVPYYTAMAGAGVSLRLRAVQVIKLVQGGSGNASGFGFDEIQDGYVAETKETNETPVQEEETTVADF
tara:strand:+ start:123 stop:770 length:648 start_codon:yes stop_codon:yes gene_type:complete